MPETREKMTKRQAAIYQYICDHCCEYGFGPTIREIGVEFDISSPNGVTCHLHALERKGYIPAACGLARTLRPMHGYAVAAIE